MPEKKVAIVTGGSRGIGRGIALGLAEAGWDLVINYRTNQSAAEETLEIIRGMAANVQLVQADISRLSDHENIIQAALDGFGRVDLLVNNAGMPPRQRVDLLEVSEASFDEVLAVNLKGPFFLSQRVASEMIRLIRAGVIARPKIIFIGSISAYTSSLSRSEYCVSKAGLGMATKLYADRLAEYDINVYELRPGIVATDMTSAVSEKYTALIASGLTPIRRWGEPDDVSRAVVAIAGDLFPFSTGEVINIDGGFHLHRL